MALALTAVCWSALTPHSSAQPATTDSPLDRWVRDRAIRLRHVEARNGFADLQPLKKALDGVRVIGLGESTHGTREFFQVKHRLLEFLVTEMGFGAFVLEASSVGCEPLNDYVLHGTGDLATVVSGQGYVVWDTDEFTELVRWMKAYNEHVPPDRKVRFHGMDFWNNDAAREYLLTFIQEHARGQAATARALFGAIAAMEAKWPMQLTDADRETMPALSSRLDALMTALPLSAHQPEGAGADGGRAGRYARLMSQWLRVNQPGGDNRLRSRFMAENALALIDESPGTRFVVWAHNTHVLGVLRSGDEHIASARRFGQLLRARLGEAYYAMALEFHEGEYLTRVLEPGEPPGDLRVVTAPSPPEEALSSQLARSGIDRFILDLRGVAASDDRSGWLTRPQMLHRIPWAYREPAQIHIELPLRPYFDGLLFMKHTTATRPTANGAAAARQRTGF